MFLLSSKNADVFTTYTLASIAEPAKPLEGGNYQIKTPGKQERGAVIVKLLLHPSTAMMIKK